VPCHGLLQDSFPSQHCQPTSPALPHAVLLLPLPLLLLHCQHCQMHQQLLMAATEPCAGAWYPRSSLLLTAAL
jgi:hypothetical protein